MFANLLNIAGTSQQCLNTGVHIEGGGCFKCTEQSWDIPRMHKEWYTLISRTKNDCLFTEQSVFETKLQCWNIPRMHFKFL
jgi:hypothetical protein